MKWLGVLSGLVLTASLSLVAAAHATATCTPTGFFVDGINMTAKLIDPGDVSVDVDASDGAGNPLCDIGVYYRPSGGGGKVNAATVHGARYFGVLVNGGDGTQDLNVDVTGSTVENIGENPHNGTQHGNAIFYINGSTDITKDDSRTCGTRPTDDNKTTGTISGNTVTGYQKNGITAKCQGVSVTISDNTVTGDGAVDYIAQNGIEVGVGAQATVTGNTVSENEYTGANDASSSGILIFGGGPFGNLASNEQVIGNTLSDNDVGVYSVNCGDADCVIAPRTDTNNLIQKNILSNDEITNVSGCGGLQGYQAAISELGRNDKINQNKFSGIGYTPNGVACNGIGTTAALFSVDRSARQGPKP